MLETYALDYIVACVLVVILSRVLHLNEDTFLRLCCKKLSLFCLGKPYFILYNS